MFNLICVLVSRLELAATSLSVYITNLDTEFVYAIFSIMKDAVDLLQGHYIPAISRDMKPSSQKGSIETKIVSLITYSDVIMLNMLLFIKFL
uniref:Putative ovule protein n=1 Tax=Solanum chacoense TaxID=4108 RepID=A0A0V0I293_SOLCH